MSTTTTLLADALLGHVTDQAVAEVLFARTSKDRTSSMLTALSPEVALKQYKGDIPKAVTAVQSTTDPMVLERFSKDPRATVRRAVAANPHLNPKTAIYLHDWAQKKGDIEVLTGVLSKVPVVNALAGLATSEFAERNYPWSQLAIGVRNDGSTETYRLAREANHHRLNVLLAPDLYEGRVEGYTLGEFLSGMEEHRAANVVANVAVVARRIDHELVALCIKHSEKMATFIRSESFCPQAVEVTDEAIPLILDSEVSQLWVAMAQCRISAPLVHKLLDKGDHHVAEELSTQKQRALTSSMADKAAMLLREGESDSRYAGNFLRNVHAKLSSESVVALLQLSSLDTVCAWLAGELPHKPRPGEITAFVQNSGRAFGYRGHYRPRGVQTSDMEGASTAEVADRLRHRLTPVLGRPWAAELVDSLGESFLTLAYSDGDVTAYLAKRLNSSLGNRTDMWEVVLTLASGWTGGLSELIEMAYLSRGEVPPEPKPAPVPVVKTPVEQLDMLSLLAA